MCFQPEELEKQYSPSLWCSKFNSAEAYEYYLSTTQKESQKVTDKIPCLQLNFGPTDPQKLDVFGDKTLPSDSPVLLYVHGGYWVFGSRKDSRFFVQPFHDAGIVCAAMSYDVVDASSKNSVTLPEIVLQVQKALCTLLKYAQQRGSKGVYIVGHSAGAHLVSMVLSSEKPKDVNYDIIIAVVAISGLYDLRSILPTTNAAAALLTREIADACSPLLIPEKLKANLPPSTRIIVQVAEHESECFLQQSKVYAQALQKAGVNCDFMLIADEDHFTIIVELYNADFYLTKYLVELIMNKDTKPAA